ncbi:oxygen-independent coproporphyrinogen III oxidase [Pontibacillus yanchengensis]|uniref:Heme chaperone HemW n=2 Tax=Pontibacillus yanchengensis TaxID=462910 RepID=A0A6I4ZWD6_9BACI|nr:radical SAM family heme chaperone HemW [Pontibacillus yanchengensis]MYL33414.1 oxygen-independent coproporphyrinogen III oxidase [Pontibacillus yanchengensis]MYL53464.1 oxygen-independent coproporphyrinogen III oxidase [Pontibacillus yanchengensis]
MISSVYIHIPFCQQICHYCDFTKFFYNKELADQYLDALDREIEEEVGKKQMYMRTIFVGGGTPTALNYTQLEQLLKTISESFDVESCEEYTFEANPGEFDEKKLALLKDYGVNRISFGVQVFDDQMLEKLGRNHRVKDVYDNLRHFEKLDFENVSVDLIYGLPGQTVEHFQQTVNEAIRLDLPHYSSYSLQIEPKTVFYQRHKKGKLHKPMEEDEAQMYELLVRDMEQSGVQQYEISNFAKPGFESKHNLTYWNNDYYYGFGSGAHGYLPGKRTVNIRPLPQYIKKAMEDGKPTLHEEPIHEKERIEEQMFLGLRKAEGVSKSVFKNRFGKSLSSLYQEELDYLKRKEWIEEKGDFIRITPQGRLFGNNVFQEFLLEDEKLQ